MPKEITKLTVVNKGYNGVRLTVPQKIMKELDLQGQDWVEWMISEKEGEKMACIKKIP